MQTCYITEINELYHTEALPGNYTDGSDTEDQINLNFHLINDLCYKNRANCADAVKSYFKTYQESFNRPTENNSSCNVTHLCT